ncbi:MAG: amino acid transporter [Rhizorhabdus sp.]|nr:amino acid transporter [Rhizorhabdus sp.]
MIASYIPGFLLGLSLIVAIGAQNAFVLRQGLRQEHVLIVCATCAVSDAILIIAGVAGFGAIIATVPWIDPVMRYGGAAFLLVNGLRAFRSAWNGGGALVAADAPVSSALATFATCLAFTWLNPHVYLDTVVLLGSVSTQYAGAKPAFAAGAMTASFLFFFSLGYGARLLRPLFARPGAWRALDILIGCVMCAIAVSLMIS